MTPIQIPSRRVLSSNRSVVTASNPQVGYSGKQHGDNGLAKDLNPTLSLLFKTLAAGKDRVGRVIASEQSGSSVKFIPYVHPTPGKTKVHVKGAGVGEDAYVEIAYDPSSIPDPALVSRSKIKLERIDIELLSQAKLVAQEIKNEWLVAKDLRKQYKKLRRAYKQELKESFKYRVADEQVESFGKKKVKTRYAVTEEKTELRKLLSSIKQQCEAHLLCNLYGKGKTVNIDALTSVFRQKINSLVEKGEIDVELSDNKAFETLATYLCLKTKFNSRYGFLKAAPHGFLDPDDKDIVERLEILGKYFLVDLMKKDTAEKVENFDGWTNGYKDAGLQKLRKVVTPLELLKICFPGYLDGPNPSIRDWKLPLLEKWQGDETPVPVIKLLAAKSCKAVILDRGVVNPDGSINIDAFLEKDWGKIFYDPKYGLRGAIGVCPFLPDTLSCIKLAVPGLVGVEEGQIPHWKFKYPNKFTGISGERVVDQITEYIVKEKLQLVDERDSPSSEKIRQVTDWAQQYNDECSGCLNRSGIGTAYVALKRVYPNLFGWRENQIQPGEIRYGGMWRGDEGRNLFMLRFAKSIHDVFEILKEKRIEGFDKHTVKFNPGNSPPLNISGKDFNLLKNYYMNHGISWYQHFLNFNLTAGFVQIAGDQVSAFEILLGKINEETERFGNTKICVDDVKDKTPTRTYLVCSLLADLDYPEASKEIVINGFDKNGYPDKRTGIEGTCLEKLLDHRPPSDILLRTNVLYEMFAAAVISSPDKDKEAVAIDKDKEAGAMDRATAFQKILIAEYPSGINKGEFILSDKNLRILLRMLTERNGIIDGTNLSDNLKKDLKGILSKIIKAKQRTGSPREILSLAVETDNQYHFRPSLITILNSVLEKTIEALAIYEMRYRRFHREYSSHFERVLGHIVEPRVKKTVNYELADNTQTNLNSTDVVEIADKPVDDETKYELLDKKKFDEVKEETQAICERRIDEDKEILQRLVDTALDTKHRMGFLTMVDEGNTVTQLLILNQLKHRASQRSLERFDYSTLRAKNISCSSISSIYSDERETVNADLIDKELWKCLPNWWTLGNSDNKAVPLLYWNNVLYLGVPKIIENSDPAIPEFILNNSGNTKVLTRSIRSDSWESLQEYFMRSAEIYRGYPNKPRIGQFISEKEENSLLENLAALRKAVKGSLN